MAELPDARSGLPKPIERTLVRPYADTALHRVGVAAAVRALGVLVRKHPRAAVNMFGAAIVQAGRTGFAEVKKKLTPARKRRPAAPALKRQPARQPAVNTAPPGDPEPVPPSNALPELDKKQLRALLKALEEDADGRDRATTPPS